MIDSFVLLTPIIMIAVVSLVVFVGCDVVFGLDRPEPGTPLLIANAGDDQVDLQWGIDEAAYEFIIKRGLEPGGETPYDTQTYGKYTYRDTDVTNGIPYYYLVSAMGEEGETPDSNEVSAIPGVAASATFLVEKMRGTVANVTGLFGMAITVGGRPLKVTELGRIFITDNNIGNSGDHILKVLDATNNQQVGAAIVVSMTGVANGQFKYGPVPDQNSIVLLPGAKYYVLSQEANPGDKFLNHNTTVTVNNPADAVVDGAARSNGPTYIMDATGQVSYGLVNFRYQVQ